MAKQESMEILMKSRFNHSKQKAELSALSHLSRGFLRRSLPWELAEFSPTSNITDLHIQQKRINFTMCSVKRTRCTNLISECVTSNIMQCICNEGRGSTVYSQHSVTSKGDNFQCPIKNTLCTICNTWKELNPSTILLKRVLMLTIILHWLTISSLAHQLGLLTLGCQFYINEATALSHLNYFSCFERL